MRRRIEVFNRQRKIAKMWTRSFHNGLLWTHCVFVSSVTRSSLE
jgi:hypothetical protein